MRTAANIWRQQSDLIGFRPYSLHLCAFFMQSSSVLTPILHGSSYDLFMESFGNGLIEV